MWGRELAGANGGAGRATGRLADELTPLNEVTGWSPSSFDRYKHSTVSALTHRVSAVDTSPMIRQQSESDDTMAERSKGAEQVCRYMLGEHYRSPLNRRAATIGLPTVGSYLRRLGVLAHRVRW